MCEHPNEYCSFQAFTSCSRDRSQAEKFGNVLFIMEIQSAFTVDLKEISEFADEEEELITPGVCFSVQRKDFDKDKKKHLFYLKLTQRFNQKDKAELNRTTSQQMTDSEKQGMTTNTSLLTLGNLLGLGDQGFTDNDLDILIDTLRAGADHIRANNDRVGPDAPASGALGRRATLFLNLLADAASAVKSHLIAAGLRALAAADADHLPFFAGILVANLPDIPDELKQAEDALNFSFHVHKAIDALKRLAGGADTDAGADLADALNNLVDIVLRDVDDNIDLNADFDRDGWYLS